MQRFLIFKVLYLQSAGVIARTEALHVAQVRHVVAHQRPHLEDGEHTRAHEAQVLREALHLR